MDAFSEPQFNFNVNQKTANVNFSAQGSPPQFVILSLRLDEAQDETLHAMESAAIQEAILVLEQCVATLRLRLA